MPHTIALVSCAEAHDHDTDLPLITRALGDRGVIARVVDWDDSSVKWSDFDCAVIRSPWDYHQKLSEFLSWVEKVSQDVTLFNSSQILVWNTDKRYLAEMMEAGIPVIPTTFVAQHEELTSITHQGLLEQDIVVKPTVSAGSNNTERHEESPVKAAAHIGELLEMGKVAMVQPYQKFIDERGETGLVYFNGEYSHAFRKGAILATGENTKNGLFTEEDISERTASEQERELGNRVMAYVLNKFGEAPLYARVDVVRGSAGVPVLMELELTEPSLYLHMSRGADTRFANAVLARQ